MENQKKETRDKANGHDEQLFKKIEDQKEKIRARANGHAEQLFGEIEKMRPILRLIGIDFGVSPDKVSFYVRIGSDSHSNAMRNMALGGAADAFSFNMEFSMVGDVTKSPACPIAMGLFLDKTLRMILNAAKEALSAQNDMD